MYSFAIKTRAELNIDSIKGFPKLWPRSTRSAISHASLVDRNFHTNFCISSMQSRDNFHIFSAGWLLAANKPFKITARCCPCPGSFSSCLSPLVSLASPFCSSPHLGQHKFHVYASLSICFVALMDLPALAHSLSLLSSSPGQWFNVRTCKELVRSASSLCSTISWPPYMEWTFASAHHCESIVLLSSPFNEICLRERHIRHVRPRFCSRKWANCAALPYHTRSVAPFLLLLEEESRKLFFMTARSYSVQLQ